ncbi:SDR family oxidoreductase [Deinococcus aquatilis]|uniref:SDR family oxidoreductase n=1 Tax=Deinococcus aquatilis TaxID=519440 RepID=UPI00037E17B9|nr:SDR family oxidoreductase [Deinococcus aquatilis]
MIGGGSGVGRGVAQALDVAGMTVIVADLDQASADTTCALLSAPTRSAQVDATNLSSLEHLARRLPELHLLVVTVGVLDMRPLDELTEAHWHWAWNLNVMTSVLAVQAFLPLLRRQPGAGIVLTGSGSGLAIREPDPLSALYATTKHALTGYAGVLRAALAPEGIHVTLLVPSGVEGNLAATSARSRAALLGESVDEVRGQQPAGRVLLPAAALGEQLVRGLEGERVYVNNRGAAFHAALMEWLDEWHHDTVESTVKLDGE